MINRSKAYLAPLLLETLEMLPFNVIKDTFIFSDFSCLEPVFYLILDGKSEFSIEKNLSELFKYEEVNNIFTIGEDYLLVATLGSEYHFEYLCFKRGNYSWYTPEAKIRIIKYLLQNVNRKSLYLIDKVRSVFARDPMLKIYYENTLDVRLGEDAELGTKMNEGEETFNSKNYERFEPIRKGIEVSSA